MNEKFMMESTIKKKWKKRDVFVSISYILLNSNFQSKKQNKKVLAIRCGPPTQYMVCVSKQSLVGARYFLLQAVTANCHR
jgi:hypothetical protein